MTDVIVQPNTQQTATANKTPGTRLLDLLLGWSEYVQRVESLDAPDDALPADELCALYQKAGAELFDAIGTDAERAAVEKFVRESVLPALLR